MAEEKPTLVDVIKLLIERIARRRRDFDFTAELRFGEKPVIKFNVKGWSVRKPAE